MATWLPFISFRSQPPGYVFVLMYNYLSQSMYIHMSPAVTTRRYPNFYACKLATWRVSAQADCFRLLTMICVSAATDEVSDDNGCHQHEEEVAGEGRGGTDGPAGSSGLS